MPEQQEHFPALARRVGGADLFILPEAKRLSVGVVYRQLGAREEAAEIDYHDREMPWTAFPEPSGGSLLPASSLMMEQTSSECLQPSPNADGLIPWCVVGGGCAASELGFENDQVFIKIGIKSIRLHDS